MDLRQLVTDRSPSFGLRLARWGLRGLSLPYALAMGGRNLAYTRGWKAVYRPRLPTVCVGNLSVGGTGKSPMVAWLAHWFRDAGIRVAILSRGYGQLDSGQNDEALELEEQLPDVPHLQHGDRVASARLADEELHMQVLLLDDGFQHRRIARDLDIVLLDATDPPSAHWVLPGGLLREPFASLHRAHAVVLTRADQATAEELNRLRQRVTRCAPRAVVVLARHQAAELQVVPDRRYPLEQLRGARVLAFCGIGNPDSFFRSLEELGAEILSRRVFPDHHPYEAADVAQLQHWVHDHPKASWVVCTAKDSVKLRLGALGQTPLAALHVRMQILEGEADLVRMLQRVASEVDTSDRETTRPQA